MKPFIIPLVVLLMLSSCMASCSTDEPELPPSMQQPVIPDTPDSDDNENNPPMSNRLKVTIGHSSFSITLENNATATAFKAQLPLSISMSEMNGNEKYYNLPTHLPTAVSRPGSIHAGDLMLYGSNCLVLFYETFSSSYNYTPLGRVDNASGLANALGKGSVDMKIEIANN